MIIADVSKACGIKGGLLAQACITGGGIVSLPLVGKIVPSMNRTAQ